MTMIIVWIVCIIINIGFSIASAKDFYSRHEYIGYVPIEDYIFAFLISLLGPIFLLVLILNGEFKHGWKLW